MSKTGRISRQSLVTQFKRIEEDVRAEAKAEIREEREKQKIKREEEEEKEEEEYDYELDEGRYLTAGEFYQMKDEMVNDLANIFATMMEQRFDDISQTPEKGKGTPKVMKQRR